MENSEEAKKEGKRRPSVPQPEIEELSKKAVRMAKEAGITLDYSDASIQLAQQFLQQQAEGKEEPAQHELARLVAVYLGDTLCRNYLMRGRGQWIADPVAGLVLKFGPDCFWPMEETARKCLRGQLQESGLTGFYSVCIFTAQALGKTKQ